MSTDLPVSLVRRQPIDHFRPQFFQFLILSALDRAFPDDQDSPPAGQEGLVVPLVALLVRFEFRTPEILPGGWFRRELAALVDVPEAPVNEHYGIEARQDEIRRSWQLSVVQAITQPDPMKSATKPHLRASIALAHTGHDP